MLAQGFVEAASEYQIRGWAHYPNSANRVHIVASVHGRDIASGLADIYRQDLEIASVGDGHHGFVLNLKVALSVTDQGATQISALSSNGTRQALPRLRSSFPHSTRRFAHLINPMPTLDETAEPVFVLGAARSGTSAITQALLRSDAFVGHEEGHCLPILPNLLSTINRYFEANADDAYGARATTLSDVPREYLLAMVRGMLINTYKCLYGESRWIDKTPGATMIHTAPLLAELWPRSKFIFIKRRALENLESRRRKFASVEFADHCLDWNNAMQAWALVAERLRLGSRLVIDNQDMAKAAHEVSSLVASFLGLSSTEALKSQTALANDQPERTSIDFGTPLALDRLGWDQSEKMLLMSLCSESMALYGYSYDDSYFIPSRLKELEK